MIFPILMTIFQFNDDIKLSQKLGKLRFILSLMIMIFVFVCLSWSIVDPQHFIGSTPEVALIKWLLKMTSNVLMSVCLIGRMGRRRAATLKKLLDCIVFTSEKVWS